MKRAAHAYRYEADHEPDPRVLPVVVSGRGRPQSTANTASDSHLLNEQERFDLVMWDEV